MKLKRVNDFKKNENIPRGASVYTADASYFGSCNQNLCLLQVDY